MKTVKRLVKMLFNKQHPSIQKRSINITPREILSVDLRYQ